MQKKSSLDFRKLREVNDTALLCQHRYCRGEPGKPPMDISLPHLEQVNERFEVGGNIARYVESAEPPDGMLIMHNVQLFRTDPGESRGPSFRNRVWRSLKY